MNNKKTITKRTTLISGGILMAIFALSVFLPQNAFATITSQLSFGDRGANVVELQSHLAKSPLIYPEGFVTGYFGVLTRAAVERFQVSKGIVSQGTPSTTGYGNVGPRTLAALNAQMARGDEDAPVITSVNVTPRNAGVTIGWTVAEAARGKVYYSTMPLQVSNVFDITGVFSGEPTVSGTLASYDGVPRSSQSISISGLAPNTTYYYLVVVLDASDNVNMTAPAFFRTN